MADTIILYSSTEHLNSMLILANFIAKHHPSISVTILSTAPYSAAEHSISGIASITYHRLTAAIIPPNFTKDPLELFFEIPRLHNPNLRQALQEIALKSNIKAMVIDFFCNSAFEVSTSMDIPTYFYVSYSASGLCVFLYLPTIDERIVEDIGDYNDFLYVPGCPPIHSRDIPKGLYFRKNNFYKQVMCTAENMKKSKGFVVNSFDALEFRAKEALLNGFCNPDGKTPPVYSVGPLVAGLKSSGKNNESSDLEPRHECLKWLDSQPSKSVIFLCFGRRGLFSVRQLREIAIGLENSGHRFLWTVRSPPEDPKPDSDLDTLLPTGFIERTKERGFVIKTWAPQNEVLSHDSVGGFVTHCGQSSILEAISFGVPMIGWPLYAEQRMNRVIMVEEMKIALPLDEEGNEGFVTASEVEKRVRELFDSTNGKAFRMKVEEMKIAAKAAVDKGGSSVVALDKFVKNVING